MKLVPHVPDYLEITCWGVHITEDPVWASFRGHSALEEHVAIGIYGQEKI